MKHFQKKVSLHLFFLFSNYLFVYPPPTPPQMKFTSPILGLPPYPNFLKSTTPHFFGNFQNPLTPPLENRDAYYDSIGDV